MTNGTKVKIKDSDETGVVMSSKDNRVSVKMQNGTARVYNADQLEEIMESGGKVESGFKVEVNQYIPYGSSMGKNYYYVTDSKGKTISKKTKKVYRGKQMNEYKFDTKEDAQKFADSMNKKYAKGGGVEIKRYKVFIYYGGEMKDKIIYAKTIEEAKKLAQQGEHADIIDTKTDKMIEYAKGGAVKKERVYIDFLNKEKNFTKDRKYFDSYEKAREWAMKNFEKFDSDMIKYEFAKGGVTEDTENAQMVLNNNKQIAHHTKELPNAIKGKKVPAWVVAKVNRSASDLSDATHYMDGQGEEFGSGGVFYNNDICIEKVVNMVSSMKDIADYFIVDKKLVIVLKEELGVYDVEVLNKHLSELEGCSNIFDDEFEIGYGEEYKTLILPLKTNDFTKHNFKKGGSISSKNESKKIKKTIAVYKIITPFEVDSEDDFGKIYKLKKGQEVNVIEYDEDDSLAFLNINGKSYSTYDLLDNAKFVKGRKLKMSYAQGGMVDGQYVDLFEYYEHIPDNIQSIIDKYIEEFGDDFGGMNYQDTANMLEEFEAEGYTFDYGLSNEPYGLRPIGVKLNQLKGYEDEDDDEDYAKGGRLTKSEDIIEAFLTSNREAKVGNLSTHYNQYEDEVLLRNYYTLIAVRKGNDVHITSVKYSVTTTKITNMINRVAKDKGLNVKYVEKFEEGGSTKSCWCYEIGGL